MNIKMNWEEFKAYVSARSIWPIVDYSEFNEDVHAWVNYRGTIVETRFKTHHPAYTDWTTNYLSLLKHSELDSDGRVVVRPAIANAGSTMYYAGPVFTAAKPSSTSWNKIDPNPPFTLTQRTWGTMTTYDNSGVATAVETDIRTTVVDMVVETNIELAGGALAIPNTLPVGNGEGWNIWAIGVPDIPAASGGSIPFVEDVKLDGFYEGEDIILDGRAPKLLQYVDGSGQAALGWWLNKIRIILNHPTGLNPSVNQADKAEFQIILDTFATGVGAI